MCDPVVLPFPDHFTALLIDPEKRLAGSTSRNEQEVAINEGRSGILPQDVPASIFLHEVLRPDHLSGIGIQANQPQQSRGHVNLAGTHCRSAAWAVVRAGVVAIVIPGQAERKCPKLLSGIGIEREADFLGGPIEIALFERECFSASHRKRTEPELEWSFPELPGTFAGPFFEGSPFRRASVRSGTAILRPISRESSNCNHQPQTPSQTRISHRKHDAETEQKFRRYSPPHRELTPPPALLPSCCNREDSRPNQPLPATSRRHL